MQQQQRQRHEKPKHSPKTKYDRLKLRILLFVAAVLVAQAIVNIGSFLHFTATYPNDGPWCLCADEPQTYQH